LNIRIHDADLGLNLTTNIFRMNFHLNRNISLRIIFIFFFQCLAFISASSQANNFVKENYDKIDTMIRMRDGIRLYTIIYIPKDKTREYPFLMERTPYSAGPYGDTNYARRIGPNAGMMNEKYIFVTQDVRGRYMSEGINLEVTPHRASKNKNETDESSDTFDTIEWLLKNIKGNNGRVGIYGISYPGFYATASLPSAHPAIKAVSPQAPVTDEFIGDDVNHGGAFFLLDNFSFMNYFGKPRTAPVKDYGDLIFPADFKDAYKFFLELGPLSNTLSSKYFGKNTTIWNEYLQNDTYNEYWKTRNIREHLKNIRVPVLVTGGWFDAENLFGALKTYQAIEQNSKFNNNFLVMGPWTHGAWAAAEWKQYASHDFGSNTSKYFQDSIETPFFNYYLKNKGRLDLAEATVFETGSNQWKTFQQWPPIPSRNLIFYLGDKESLSANTAEGYEEYISDPAKPVPYTNGIFARRNNDYMSEDQRFAFTRPDVLSFETEILTEDIHIAGPVTADLFVSMTGTDADFVVKLIDVLPDTEPNFRNAPRGFQMAGYQRMVRAEVIRGKFRNSFEKPEAFKPGEKTKIRIELNDVAHLFKKGHKVMVQVQSSWFPLVDRNPNQFLSIPAAKESDFIKNNIRLYHSSSISLPVIINK